MLIPSLIHATVIATDVASTDLMRHILLENVVILVVEETYAIGITYKALMGLIRHLIFSTQLIPSATALRSLMLQNLQLFIKVNIITKITGCQAIMPVFAQASPGPPTMLPIVLVVIIRNQRRKLFLLTLLQHIKLLGMSFQPRIH